MLEAYKALMGARTFGESNCNFLIVGDGSLILKTTHGTINDEDVPVGGCSVRARRKAGENVRCPKNSLPETISPFCWRINQVRNKKGEL